MANNSLEHVYELVDLKYLKKLNLAHNQIVSLCNTDFVASPDTEILPVVSLTICVIQADCF